MIKPHAIALLGACIGVACGAEPQILSTTALGDTYDSVGPYFVRSVVAAPEAADSVRLSWRREGAEAVTVSMRELRQGIFEGEIPGAPAFTRIAYWVEVSSGDGVQQDPPGPRSPYGFWVRGAPCSEVADCGAGQWCDDSGVCRDAGGSCEVDLDCGKGFRCASGACAPIIRSCTFDQGCLAGEICSPLLAQCQVRPGCVEPDQCPLGFVCRDAICLRACDGDTDCFASERCSGGACGAPVPCTESRPCPSPLACDAAAGLCRPYGAAPCSPCVSDADCGGPQDHCLVVEDALRCGRDCSLLPCDEGFRCDTSRALPQCMPVAGICP